MSFRLEAKRALRMDMLRSLSHDTKKCDTHVYLPLIRRKQLSNWPNMYAKRLQKLVNRMSSAVLQGGCHHCNMLLIVLNIKDVVVISLDGKTLLGARFIRRYFLRVQQRNERLYHPSRGTVSSLIKPNTVSSLNNHSSPPGCIFIPDSFS